MAGIGEYARSTPDAAAIVTLAGTITFAELDARQAKITGLLRAGGLRREDRIAILSANRPEWLEVSIAALRTGIVPVPINNLLTSPEIAYLLEDSGARWLFTDRSVDADLRVDRVITFGDAYERCLHDAEDARMADLALGRPMHYTSGTTGVPKGVWVPPVGQVPAGRISSDFQREWGMSSDDVHLVCSPLAHSAPHRFALRTMEAGGRIVLPARFEAAETLTAIELFSVTSTFVVPTHLERLFSLGWKAMKRHDLSSLRLLAHAGAPIRHETKRNALDIFPPGSVWEFYGSTEGQATRISTEEWLRKPGSVGTPRAGATIEIRSDDGWPLPPGRVGTVWVKDPQAERFEYWGDPDKTANAWIGDAFSVGDLGRLDEDGYLWLEGRKHDTIITGGVNVYPQEVELVLAEHPGVLDVAVYGSPHDEWGQEVRAAVVPVPEFPLDPEHLRTWARSRLAGFKCPRGVDIVDELPRTPTGKIRRDLLGPGDEVVDA